MCSLPRPAVGTAVRLSPGEMATATAAHPRRETGQAARTALAAMPGATAATRWAPALLALAVLGLWTSLWVAALLSILWAVKLVLALLCGTLAGLLVILGHDAAHGALTPWRAINPVLARLCFLPPWQTASGWQQAHREHHAYTNLKSHDDGYPPPSPSDWTSMRPWCRTFWRFKHTLPGLFLFYLDVWWRRVIWPRRPDARRTAAFRADSLMVLCFIAAQVLVVLAFGHQQAVAASPGVGTAVWKAMEVVLLVMLPFIACNWWVSAITLQQHRHRDVRWFDNLAAWQQGHDQVSGTVHLVWRQPAPWLLFNIFEHTAHHIDPQRSFALLAPAQQRLAEALPEQVIRVDDPKPWRLRHLRHVLNHCQLHDYGSGRWMRFDDVTTSG